MGVGVGEGGKREREGRDTGIMGGKKKRGKEKE